MRTKEQGTHLTLNLYSSCVLPSRTAFKYFCAPPGSSVPYARTAIASHASVVYILSLMMLNQVLKLVGFTVKKEAGKDAENVGGA